LTWILTTYLFQAPRWIETAIEGALTLGMLMVWFRWRRSGWEAMLWITCLTLVVTQFVAPRTATTHYAVLVLGVFMLFRRWAEVDPPRSAWWIGFSLAGSLAASWILFVISVEGIQESALNYIPAPLIIAGYLLVDRRRWLKEASS
jgi:uncharacterized membrane protein YfcA